MRQNKRANQESTYITMNMRNKIQTKIKEKLYKADGFSFSEMLVCTLILLLSTGLVTSTLSLGIQQFKEQSSNTDKQIFLNTLTLAIRDELSYVTTWDDADDTFKSTAILALQDKECRLTVDSGKVVIDYGDGNYPLVAAENYGSKADGGARYKVKPLTIEKKDNQFVVTLTVENADDTGEKTETFTVKPINKNALSAAGHINDNPTGTGDTSTDEPSEGEEQVYD